LLSAALHKRKRKKIGSWDSVDYWKKI